MGADREREGILSEKRAIKAVGYRITASLLAQFISWILFGSITVNLSVLIADLSQMVWYYIYDTIFYEEIQDEGRTIGKAG